MAISNSFFQKPGRLLWLILVSLLLLCLSQLLWIRRVWEEQKESLQQEANYIFQRTVMDLQDSLVRKSTINLPTKEGVMANWAGSSPGPPPFPRKRTLSQIKTEFKIGRPLHDVKMDTVCGEDQQVQVYISSSDTYSMSFPRGLGRIFLNVRNDSSKVPVPNMVFDIQADTVPTLELKTRYTIALDSAGLPHSFHLHMNEEPEFDTQNSFVTEPALAGLFSHRFYLAEFSDYKTYLLGKVVPYVLFSVLLLGLTSLAFWLIFNNLKQQQKLAQQKNEFISNVTHELKTPLTTVGVALEALHDFEVLRNPEKTREYLQISQLELERLNLLVDKVLRLSMFEQQALQLNPELLQLNSLVKQVINAMTLQAQNADASIRFNPVGGDYWVKGDRLHLTGVVYNLLDNALKYRREQPEINVSMEQVARDGQVFVSLKVQDNGIGIAPTFQRQVFEKFFRVPVGDTHNVKGHGLGLSYVAHVVAQHGGSIRLESQKGLGSIFTVEIPQGAAPTHVG